MTRRYNPRRAKRHLSYSRSELCEIFDVGLAAISAWTRTGLTPIDSHRPFLFAGADVQQFLERHNQPHQPTGPGEVFCVACKRVIEPAGAVVDFVPLGPTNGNLVGTCPRCFHGVCQRVRKDDIARKAGHLKVRYEDDSATLGGNGHSSRTEHSTEM